MTDVALQTIGLSKQYGALRAVDDLNLSVGRGRICGFLGPNGAGKTTTIRMLLGLSRPTGGRMAIFGRDALAERAAVVPMIGAMLETPSFYPNLTALANLRVCALASGIDAPDDRLRALLARVGLAGRETAPARSLSLGMRQRLGLAAALLSDPGLLLLDEPANGLDPQGIADLRVLLRDIAAEGRAILLSSHVLAEVEQTCDEVMVLNRGRAIMHGPIADLLGAGTLVVTVSDPGRAVALLQERLGMPSRVAAGGALEVPSGAPRSAEIIRLLVMNGVDVHAAAPRQARLEALFLELTGTAPAAPRAEA